VLRLAVDLSQAQDLHNHIKEVFIEFPSALQVERQLAQNIEQVFGDVELLNLFCVLCVQGLDRRGVHALLLLSHSSLVAESMLQVVGMQIPVIAKRLADDLYVLFKQLDRYLLNLYFLLLGLVHHLLSIAA